MNWRDPRRISICATRSSTTVVLGGARPKKCDLRQICSHHTQAIFAHRNNVEPKDSVLDGLGKLILGASVPKILKYGLAYHARNTIVFQDFRCCRYRALILVRIRCEGKVPELAAFATIKATTASTALAVRITKTNNTQAVHRGLSFNQNTDGG